MIKALKKPVISGFILKSVLCRHSCLMSLTLIMLVAKGKPVSAALDQRVNLEPLVGFLQRRCYVKASNAPQFQSSWMLPLKLRLRLVCVLNTTARQGAASWSL